MKILIVMAGFLPGQKYGGPPISVDNFCTLMEECECYIVTINHDMGENEIYPNITKGWNDRGNCKVLYLSDKEYCYSSYEKIIKEIKPDIIYLQGLFQKCVIPCLMLAKKHNIGVLLASRGELCSGAFKKKYKKIPYLLFLRFFRLLDNVKFQSTSEEETLAIAKYLGVNKSKITLLTNVPSIPKEKYPVSVKEVGKAKFVFVSRIVRKKNLLTAILLFKNIKGDATFDIYGPIEDKNYWLECQEAIKSLPNNIIVNYCGLLSHDKIHETFAKYHAFIFPTFSENFGHVIAEALSVGCPVIISNQTPWNDVINCGAGWAIPLDNINEFIKAINVIIWNSNEKQETLNYSARNMIKQKMKLKLLRENYENILK